ncbi:MAG: flavin reductase family protein [Chloroflexota bacterium]|nr:flavin reductase family protein [Chloroflexota bacterium]
MDGRRFREIAGSFPTGVTVITTRDQAGRPVGMTMNSFSSLSLEPLLIMYSIAKAASLYRAFMTSDIFAVNILAACQEDLARQFAQKGVDRFAGVVYTEDQTGAPILPGALGYFDCRMVMRHQGGDHTIVVGEVVGGDVREGNALTFYRGRYLCVPSAPVVELLTCAS